MIKALHRASAISLRTDGEHEVLASQRRSFGDDFETLGAAPGTSGDHPKKTHEAKEAPLQWGDEIQGILEVHQRHDFTVVIEGHFWRLGISA